MQWRIGETLIHRIEESLQPSFKPSELFPNFEPDSIERHLSWLAPNHYDVGAGRFITSIHGFVVHTKHHIVLIDTCGGNHKHRPYFPRFHQKTHPWLDRLRAVGVVPESVDYVMCTHLHLDHVGWNTYSDNGRFVPTFPNARYLFHRKELDRWNPAHPTYSFAPHNEFVWEDSVAPIIAAGQAVAIDDGYTLDDTLTVEPAPGHTLGHIRIRLRDGGQEAIFSGDIMHVPLQVYYPQWYTCLDDDPQLGVKTRRELLENCAERNALLLPTHFTAPHGCRILDKAGDFSLEWVR